MSVITETPFKTRCEILIYANTQEVENDLHICTEFGQKNFPVFVKIHKVLTSDEIDLEAIAEINQVWDFYLEEEFGLTDIGFTCFLDILNAF